MSEMHNKWRADRGDEILVLDYPLDENSQVIELGGFQGLWTKRISSKFNCNVLVIEPVKQFYDTMLNEFDYYLKNNRHKIITENNGISVEEKEITLSVDGDATSAYLNSNHQQKVKCYPLEHFLNKNNIQKVDLMQVNVEGEEYPLMEKWIESGVLKNIHYIQVQYHRMGENYEMKHKKIQEGLKQIGFKLRWDYSFVWESWENTMFEK